MTPAPVSTIPRMNIKRFLLLAILGGAFTCLSGAQAAPRGGSNQSRDFLAGSSEYDGWSCGLFFLSRDKAVEVENFLGDLDDQKFAAYVGHTLSSWITVYGIAGTQRSTFSQGFAASGDQKFLYGAAANFDLFSSEIQDPVIMENQIRVNADLAYYKSMFTAFGEEFDVDQFDASLTASLLNDLDGVALYMPESIAIFAGPVYSQLTGDVNDDPDNAVGYTAGLEVFQTKRVSYYVRVEDMKNTGYGAGVNVRF